MKQPSQNQADYGEAEQRAAELLRQCDALGALVPDVAHARAILAYSGDRCKRALALAVKDAPAVEASSGKPASFAAREAHALASENYGDRIRELQHEDEAAEVKVAEWHAINAKIDALRSVVALEKQKAAIL